MAYKARKRKVKKNVPEGKAFIHSTFNNTIVTLTDKEGNAISNECMIYANSTSSDVQDRMTICKFNFISKKYDSTKDYYLVIKDENGLEYKRFNYIIDII